MDKPSLRKLKMYIVVLLLLNSRTAIWIANLAFKAEVDALDAGITLIKAKDLINKKSNSATKTKNQLFRKMIKSAEKIIGAGVAYASHKNDDGLMEKFNFTYKGLRAGNEVAVLERCKNIALATVGIAADLVLFNMPATAPATLTADCQAFETIFGSTKSVISAGKSANKIMNATYKEMDTLLNERLDNMVPNFGEAFPEFIIEYDDARYIGGWSKPPDDPPIDPEPPV